MVSVSQIRSTDQCTENAVSISSITMGLVKVLVQLHRDIDFGYIFGLKYLIKSNKTVTVTYSEVFPYELATCHPWTHIVLSINILYRRAKWPITQPEWFCIHGLLHRRYGFESLQISLIIGWGADGWRWYSGNLFYWSLKIIITFII